VSAKRVLEDPLVPFETNRQLDLIIVGKEGEMVLYLKEAPMPDSVETQLKNLPNLSREGLIELWQTLFHSEPDPKLRKPFMIRFLAYRIQEQAYGALTSSSERRLRQLQEAIAGNMSVKTTSGSKIRTGTRLIREWQNPQAAWIRTIKLFN
jgi:Protein of unknown function (DUF2924)